MSILAAQDIRKLCISPNRVDVLRGDFESYQRAEDLFKQKIALVSPFVEKTIVNGMSYGLTGAGYDIRIKDDIELWPGEFKLGVSLEHFNIPTNLRGVVYNKSSWARKGLDQAQTILEPGWSGYLTLELSNKMPQNYWDRDFPTPIKQANPPIIIPAGSPIAQITFEQLTQPTDRPYTGKYQNQPAVPVEAINER